VYAGGYSESSSNVAVAGYWKNGSWNGLPPLNTGSESLVYSIQLSGGDVYAGGYSKTSANAAVAGYWKNGMWTALPVLDAAYDSQVFAMFIVE